MEDSKSFTFKISEKVQLVQSGTVTVEAPDLSRAVANALNYSQQEHHGDAVIDFDKEKPIYRSIESLLHVEEGLESKAESDPVLLKGMLNSVPEGRRSKTMPLLLSKRLVQLQSEDDEIVGLIAVRKGVTDQQVASAHQEYCAYREVCEQQDQDEIYDFEQWASEHKPTLDLERILGEEILVGQVCI